jgi:hypothetical protein
MSINTIIFLGGLVALLFVAAVVIWMSLREAAQQIAQPVNDLQPQPVRPPGDLKIVTQTAPLQPMPFDVDHYNDPRQKMFSLLTEVEQAARQLEAGESAQATVEVKFGPLSYRAKTAAAPPKESAS